MTTLFGSLSGRPLRLETQKRRFSDAHDDLMRLLNQRVRPPVPLRLEDVHIRALRLVSDEVNDHGGRFPRAEHARLTELLVDTPVLIGHERSRLPVARNFAARIVDDIGRQWVEVWFYWLKAEGRHHDQLALDIDGGVVKEGSIGFEFRLPQCSICGQDIRICEHIPDFEYPGPDGSVQTAHYEYRDIIRVLETSLVYRGATPDTHIVKYPLFDKSNSAALTRSAPQGSADRPLPGGEANSLTLIGRDHTVPPTRSAMLPSTLEAKSRSPLPSACPERSEWGEVGPVVRRDRVRETQSQKNVRSLLRDYLSIHSAHRSFHCPARTVPWPGFVFDYRAGHGPLVSPRLRRRG